MSLEARVTVLEERQAGWDRVLSGIEGTGALILRENLDFKKEVLFKFKQQDERFDQMDKRFDQVELLIRQLIPKPN